MATVDDYETNEEINILREYLRIPSVHPDVDYAGCVQFLQRQAARLGLSTQIKYPAHPKKPVVILTWPGAHPELPSLLLNSHMDVVPVYEELWTHPPFGADMDQSGRIYARGAQDMKSVGAQYLSAIGALQASGVAQLRRTVHVVFVPDEEIGGTDGMMAFVRTAAFKQLNVGFALDEGLATPDDTFPVYYAERSVWRVHFTCNGTSGHGSLLHTNTAGEKLRRIINHLLDYREREVQRLAAHPEWTVADVTTVNLTVIRGGVQTNVVPPDMTVGFDIRLALDVDHGEFERRLNDLCTAAGGDISIRYESKKPKVAATPIDASNAFWVAFERVLVGELGLRIRTQVFPGRTDSCFLREVGIPALGFSPLNRTPVLLHDHDEFIDADVYLRGVAIYERLIVALANVK